MQTRNRSIKQLEDQVKRLEQEYSKLYESVKRYEAIQTNLDLLESKTELAVEEQEEIVSRLNTLFSRYESTELRVDNLQDHINRRLQWLEQVPPPSPESSSVELIEDPIEEDELDSPISQAISQNHVEIRLPSDSVQNYITNEDTLDKLFE
jgi:DNA repair exonuclease SbcCD ATPase subunit